MAMNSNRTEANNSLVLSLTVQARAKAESVLNADTTNHTRIQPNRLSRIDEPTTPQITPHP